ncbi:MAG: porin family protein [Bacteroidia bacterium]
MKKQLTLSLCLLFTMAGFAQTEDSPKKIRLGLLASGGIGWMSPESKNVQGGGAKAGIGFGVFGDFYFAKNYAFSLEVNHSTQGYKIKADSISYTDPTTSITSKQANVTIDYRIRAFQIPISLKLRTNEIGYMRYFGQLGIAPTFAYKTIFADFDPAIFPKADDNIDRQVNDTKNDFDYVNSGKVSNDNKNSFLEEDNLSGFRLPLIIGAGAEWTISGNTAITFGIRYEYGLVNVMRAENTIARPNAFNLLVGVRF